MFWRLTKNGYRFGEVLSALQKDIRRGKEEEALFWALELCPEFEDHLWSRLVIIAYEDVSSLVPGNIPTVISRMREDYFRFHKLGNSAAL